MYPWGDPATRALEATHDRSKTAHDMQDYYYTSRNLREEFDFGLPSLWTRSYFVSSAGEVSTQTIEEYIEAQTGR